MQVYEPIQGGGVAFLFKPLHIHSFSRAPIKYQAGCCVLRSAVRIGGEAWVCSPPGKDSLELGFDLGTPGALESS